MKYPKKWQLKFGTSYQGITYKLMYLFEKLKYFNRFMLIEDFNLWFKLIYISFCLLLFPFFLKAAFKYTSIKKVHFSENFHSKMQNVG